MKMYWPRAAPGLTGKVIPLGWLGNDVLSPSDKIKEVAVVREVLASLLRLLPCDSNADG